MSESTSAVDRTLRIIFAIADSEQPDVGVTELARDLELPKTVVHRVLRRLVAMNFVSYNQATRRYGLGPGALTVGLAALRGLDVPRVARQTLEQLVHSTGETATLSALQGRHRVYVEQVLSPQELRQSVPLGVAFPLYAGSSSKCILAAMSLEEADAYIDTVEMSPLTTKTVIDRAALRREVVRIRKRGFSATFGERQVATASVAAAVLQPGGRVFGALSVCGPVTRFEKQLIPWYGELVQAAAMAVSRELGYRPFGVPAGGEPNAAAARRR